MVASTTPLRLQGRRNADFYPREELFRLLGPKDVARLTSVITDTSGIDGRSLALSLQNPLFFQGTQITQLAVRAKGIDPKTQENNVIPMHTGLGYVAEPVNVNEEGFYVIGKPTSSPEGTCPEKDIIREYDAALDLEGEVTDSPLGYGFYDGMEFNGERVGFILYLMQSQYDTRLLKNYISSLIKADLTDLFDLNSIMESRMYEFSEAFKGFAQVMALMHKKGYAHGYPHFDNVGVIRILNFIRFIMRDMESAKKLMNMTPKQRVASIMVDIGKIMIGLSKERGTDYLLLNFTEYIPTFVYAYLGMSEPYDPAFKPYDYRALGQILLDLKEPFDAISWAKNNESQTIRQFYNYLVEHYAPELERAAKE